MKSVAAIILDVIAKAVLGAAIAGCGAASAWDLYQPKEPAALKKMIKK